METKDIKDVKLVDALRKWRIRPDSIGKKYMAVNVFPGHMSIFPTFHEDSLEVRVKMHISSKSADVEWISYVIDLETNQVVYALREFDDMPVHEEEEILKYIAEKNMAIDLHLMGRNRDGERYEFKQLIKEAEEMLQARETQIIAEMYSEYAYEKGVLGYEVLPFGVWRTQLTDEQKERIKDQTSTFEL